jgi:hypothetical protein
VEGFLRSIRRRVHATAYWEVGIELVTVPSTGLVVGILFFLVRYYSINT